jgi:agmatine/peptidylarginine deiminase
MIRTPITTHAASRAARRFGCVLLTLLTAACTAAPKAERAGPRLVAEWEPAVGALVVFPFELPDELVRDLAAEAPLFVLVGDADRAAAAEKLRGLGVDSARAQFVPTAARSPWTRDWGPHQVARPDGAIALVDHVFRGYPWVPADCAPEHFTYRMGRMEGEDEAVPMLASALGLATVSLPAIATGGNLLTDGRERAFCTRAQIIENHDLADEAAYRALLRETLGITDLVVLENTEPFGIQHIDCWLKVIDPETLLIKAAPVGHPEHAPIERNVALLAQLTTPSGGRYRIERIDCPPFRGDRLPAYTNSLRLGNVVHVPLFGGEADERALATYRAVLPSCEVRGYRFDGWLHFDALHCRTRALHAVPTREKR